MTTNDGSFTVSFYLQTASDSSTGGVFEFVDSQFGSTDRSFQIQYSDYTIIVTANKNTIGRYNLLQRKSVWTFLSFVFNDNTAELSVFSEHGLAYAATVQPFLLGSNNANNGGIRLGYSTLANAGLNKGDAVSCLSLYSTTLNWSQIKQLQQACRIIHGSSLSGTPKLPLTPIPSVANPPITTIPIDGQFPWLGILATSDGNVVCTISILDEYWVLTTATCFASDVKESSSFVVKIGVYDSSYASSNTKVHEIESVFKSGTSDSDIALAQLKSPIDFKSDYINDACLFDGDPQSIQIQGTQFVNGWGINGRHPLASETLPRFVAGNTLADNYCNAAWNQSFDSSKDYCFLSSTTDKNVPCKGDEGSPLMYAGVADNEMGIGDRLIQVGLYFKRGDLCTKASPGLFVDISQFSNWISQQMACAVPGSDHQPTKCPQ